MAKDEQQNVHSKASEPHPKGKRVPKTPAIAWLTWKRLSTLGNIYFLRVSYVILVAVPIWATFQQKALAYFFNDVPLALRLGYFSSLLLSLAHMVYQGFCPQIIRRFDSPNDLYRDMLNIKALQSQYLTQDKGFEFNIAHCRERFRKANIANVAARVACGLFYGVGLVLVAWLVIERSLVVLGFNK